MFTSHLPSMAPASQYTSPCVSIKSHSYKKTSRNPPVLCFIFLREILRAPAYPKVESSGPYSEYMKFPLVFTFGKNFFFFKKKKAAEEVEKNEVWIPHRSLNYSQKDLRLEATGTKLVHIIQKFFLCLNSESLCLRHLAMLTLRFSNGWLFCLYFHLYLQHTPCWLFVFRIWNLFLWE